MKKKRPPKDKENIAPIEDSIRQIFHEGLASLMEALGYKLQGSVLRKTQGEAVFLIELHTAKWNEGESGDFVINLGVHYPALVNDILRIPAYAYLRSALEPPNLNVCAYQVRLGELWKGTDYWWHVGPESDLKVMTEQLTVVLVELGLAWLKDRQDWRCLLKEEDLSIFGLAAWRRSADGPGFAQRLTALLEREKDGARRAQLQAWGT